MHKYSKIAVIGATGYTGVELTGLLMKHPHVEITHATSETHAGKQISEVYPHLSETSISLEKLNLEQITKDCDLAFIALPHGHSIEIAKACIDAGMKVIDLGADFRIKDAETYKAFYQSEFPSQALMSHTIYGLPEITSLNLYKDISIIANPGCYPTSAILGAAPLLVHDCIYLDHIILDGKSGVSGAGRSLSLGTHFCEVAENFKAYKVAGTHRHTPEIEQAFSELASKPLKVNFTPHLIPMTRGLFMTGYYRVKEGFSEEKLRKLYDEYYADADFIDILPENLLPETKDVRNTNRCKIGINFNKDTQTVIVTSVIDNLVKGASGQAVQNMNRLLGLPETTGL